MDNDIGVYKTDMSVQTEQFIVSQALLLSENENDLNIVATKISNEMNKMFGKSWSCLTGNSVNISGVNVELNENIVIWFSFRGKHFIVFKQPLMEKTAEVNIKAQYK